MKIASALSVFAALLFAATHVSAADLGTKKSMTLAAAKKIAAAAEAEAAKNKWTMVIAVLDDGANLVYLEKMDDTQIGSIDVAVAKAASAIKFKRNTKVFEDALAGGRQAILKLPGAIPVEGGVVFMDGNRVIGAVGVSGATSAQDGVVAAAAEAEFKKLQ